MRSGHCGSTTTLGLVLALTEALVSGGRVAAPRRGSGKRWASAYDAVAERRRWAKRLVSGDSSSPTPVVLVTEKEWEAWRGSLAAAEAAWVDAMLPGGWKLGATVALPGGAGGGIGAVASCADLSSGEAALASAARLAGALPAARVYRLEEHPDLDGAEAALGWCLGSYSLQAYKKSPATEPETARLEWPACDREAVDRAASATYLVRDLISTPAEDMGPADMEAVARSIAADHGAVVEAITGDDLLTHNFPMVHAVGRAAASGREPRLVRLDWRGDRKDLPLVTLVGKGVAFDTGGLDIKPAQAMLTMKKDMGGAAHCLGLADMVMRADLDLRLCVLLGCVENSISGASFRPGDVLVARNGRTTEIANTDAEGRLVLADLLVLAEESDPDLLVDVATLTGAGRVALGTDVPALFCNDDRIASQLQGASAAVADAVWRLPLWSGYEADLDSKIADCKNVGAGPYGGAITAALYLQRFLRDRDGGTKTPWIHIDVMAYNTKTTPGKPEGGEAMGMRGLFALLEGRYSPQSSP